MSKLSTILAAVLVMTLARGASAQPSMTEVAPLPPQSEAPAPVEHYRPGTALLWSLATTAAGYGALVLVADSESDGAAQTLGIAGVAAIMVGPNAGDIYAGNGRRALLHTGIRTGGLALFVAGVMTNFDECFLESGCDESAGMELVWLGAGIFIADTIYSIATAPSTARKRNDEINARLRFTPTPIAGTAANGNKPGLGVALAGQF